MRSETRTSRDVRSPWLAASCWLLTSGFWLFVQFPLREAAIASPVLRSPPLSCPANLETLTALLLRDLPSYANRVTQSARRPNRSVDLYSYMLVAGRPELAPLTLGPGVYEPATPETVPDDPQQVFFTTLERNYTTGKAVELQQYHWLFLTQTESGWRLAMMFSQTGPYPGGRPPTAPRDSSHGVVAQAIKIWLRDCRAGVIR